MQAGVRAVSERQCALMRASSNYSIEFPQILNNECKNNCSQLRVYELFIAVLGMGSIQIDEQLPRMSDCFVCKEGFNQDHLVPAHGSSQPIYDVISSRRFPSGIRDTAQLLPDTERRDSRCLHRYFGLLDVKKTKALTKFPADFPEYHDSRTGGWTGVSAP